MADDITLTVRVRDMTRAAFSRIDRDLARLQRRLRSSSRDSNVFDRLGDRLRRMQDHLNRSTAFVGRFRGALNSLASRGLTPLIRASTAMGSHMRRVFRQAADDTGGLRRAMHTAARATSMLFGAMRRLGSALNVNQRWTAILVATLLLIGPAAQALGALLVTALGGAFIALGAFALRGNSEVKSAFQEMKSTIGSTVREAAQPLAGPLASAMNHLGDVAVALGPQLRQAFEATGPIVMSFSRAIGNLASESLPGMVSALQNSKGAMAGFESAMGLIGKGFGDMFRIITEGNDNDLARAWVTLGNEIRNVFESLGQFISTSLKSGTATLMMVGVFRTFTGALNLVAGALKVVDALFGEVFKGIADYISGFNGLGQMAGNSFKFSSMSINDLKGKLEGVNKAIKQTREDLAKAKEIPGSAGDSVRGRLNSQLSNLIKERDAIQNAIKSKMQDASKAYEAQAKAIQSVIDKTRELNELNRGNLDARAAQQQAILDANKGYKDFADALHMSNGQLDLTNQKALDAYEFLSKVAGSTNAATKAAQDAHRPWSEVQATWRTGYDNLVHLADGMGLTREEAQFLAQQIVNMPDPEINFKANTHEAITDLQSFIAAVKNAPGSKSVMLKTLSARAEAILRNFGYKVKRLPDGSVQVTAKTGTAASNIQYVKGILNSLDGTVATTYVQTVRLPDKGKSVHEMVGAIGGSASSLAHAKKFGVGGSGSISGGVLDGPGTKTSDSILARLSRGEFVMRAAAVDKYGIGFMQAVNHGLIDKLPGFARGGGHKKKKKLTKKQLAAKRQREAEQQARGEAMGELTISHFGRMAGYKNDEFRHQLGLPETLGSLVDDLNKWRRVIQKTTHGGLEKSLNKRLDAAGKALIRYEKAHAKVEKQLDAAKNKLADLKQAASQLRESVTSGVMSATNITGVASGDKDVTVSSIMARMREGVDKSTAFSQALKDLAKKGVSKTIIQQIAEAGIEGGGLETAGALLSASASEIKTINEMQGKINSAAKSAGKTTADIMYASGIKAAEGLVNGLTKKKKAIEDAMMNIAKAMEKAIKKALKIKSPSKVMQDVGHFTAEGFAVGIKKNRRVDNAWTSMLNVPSEGAAGISASQAGGAGQQVIQVYIGNKMIDEIVLDSGRRVVRTRGGNVQAVFGRK